jgi:inner membrane protein
MGYLIYRVTAKPVAEQRWRDLGLYLLVANAADLDFLPGLFVGDPNRYHHGISHSLGFAVLVALACTLLVMLRDREAKWQLFAIYFALWGSHIGLDYCGIDTSLPYGVPAFWPLSDTYYMAPFAFFPDIRRAVTSSEFLTSLVSLHNLWAICVELFVMAPILILIWIVRKHAKSLAAHNPSPPPSALQHTANAADA